MAVKMHIMPEHGLSYLHYSGHITAAEMSFSLSACADHPDFRAHFRHIADLSGVTSFENDYIAIMKVQAQAVGMLQGKHNPSSCIFLTPSVVSQTFANIVARSWDGIDDPVIVILAEPEQVDGHLGLRDMKVSRMREAAQPLFIESPPRASLPRA